MWDRIVIDSCVIMNDGDMLRWLGRYRGDKIFPLMAYIEYSIAKRRRGKSQADIDHSIKKIAKMEISHFTEREAKNVIEIVTRYIDPADDRNFRDDWRDCVIASYAYVAPTKIVTYNVSDFNFLGDRVITPQQLKARYSHMM